MPTLAVGFLQAEYTESSHNYANGTLRQYFDAATTVPLLYDNASLNDSACKYFISPVEFQLGNVKYKDFHWDYDSINFLENVHNITSETVWKSTYTGWANGQVIDLQGDGSRAVVVNGGYSSRSTRNIGTAVSDGGTGISVPKRTNGYYDYVPRAIIFTEPHSGDSYSKLAVRANTRRIVIYLYSQAYSGSTFWHEKVYDINLDAKAFDIYTNCSVTTTPLIAFAVPSLAESTSAGGVATATKDTMSTSPSTKKLFTISLNVNPNRPSSGFTVNGTSASTSASSPAVVSNTLLPKLAWTFSDGNTGDYQSAFDIEIVNSSTNAVVVSKYQSSGYQYYNVLSADNLSYNILYKYRVRTYDRYGASSDWSNYYFFKLNRSPNGSTGMTPAGTSASPSVQSTLTPTLSWVFSDPDGTGDSQSAYEINLMDGTNTGIAVWNSGKVAGGAQSVIVPTGKLSPDKLYAWRVRTWDRYGAVGPFTNYQYFRTTKKPVFTPKSPIGTRTFPYGTNETPRLEWTYSDPEGHGQRSFRIYIRDVATNGVVHDSGEIMGTANRYDVPEGILEPGKVYGWYMNGSDSTVMWSDMSAENFLITNIPPKPPMITGPTENVREGKRPVFEMAINNDREGDKQHYQLQIAEDAAFTVGTLLFDTSVDRTGWEVYDGESWTAFPAEGVRYRKQLVVDSSFAGDRGNVPSAFWRLQGTKGVNDYVDMAATPKTGNNALRVINNSGTAPLGVLQELKGWKPGDRLKLQATVFAIRLHSGAQIHIDLLGVKKDSTIVMNTNGIVLSGATTKYETYMDEVTVPQDCDVLYVRAYTSGANTANTEFWVDQITVDIVSPATYTTVRFTPQHDLVEGKKYYWRVAGIDATTGTMGDWSNQRKLKNELGTSGSMPNTTDWGVKDASHLLDANGKVVGINSMKVSIAAGKSSGSIYKRVSLRGGSCYFVGGYVKNGNAKKACLKMYGVGESAGVTDQVHYKFEWFKAKPAYDTTVDLELMVEGIGGQYAFFDGIRVYEVPEEEYKQIGKDPGWTGENLALKFPYRSGEATINTPSTVRIGDRLQFELKKPIVTSDVVKRLVLNAVRTVPLTSSIVERIQQNDVRLSYTGVWEDSPLPGYDIGGRHTGVTAAGTVEFTFTGNGIRWVGAKHGNCGIARVYINGIPVRDVDLYTASIDPEYGTLYEKLDLPYGTHNIKIQALMEKNKESSGTVISLDYFEAVTTETPAKLKVEATNNGMDALPQWEDITSYFLKGSYYDFVNKAKTAIQWGLNIKVTIEANGSFSPVEIDGFGVSYE